MVNSNDSSPDFISLQRSKGDSIEPGTSKSIKAATLILGACSIAVVLVGVVRYIYFASFWLDEAFVAMSLRNPSIDSIFGKLRHGQQFPRFYLSAIATLREIFGYEVGAIRFLPLVSFITGTILWVILLAKRAGGNVALGLLAGGLLIGSGFWLDQATQLKPYTLDVTLALVPFLLGDSFFDQTLAEGKHKRALVLLAIPCLLSYVYPLPLGARVLGWYLNYGRRNRWRISVASVLTLGVTVTIALTVIVFTDHRFNFLDRPGMLAYWKGCILRFQLQEAAGDSLRLIGDFLWGWHTRIPRVTTGIVPLQILGLYWTIKKWLRSDSSDDNSWGSRSLGSIVLLIGAIAMSAIVSYPICAGRLTLFAQVHLQLLTLQGALFLLELQGRYKLTRILLYSFIAILLYHNGRDYKARAFTEPKENLMPLVAMIKPEIADSVWVHSCSRAQVQSLPGGLPATEVITGTRGKLPERGKKVWIVWTFLGSEACQTELEELQKQSLSWQVISEGTGRGLVLAQF